MVEEDDAQAKDTTKFAPDDGGVDGEVVDDGVDDDGGGAPAVTEVTHV